MWDLAHTAPAPGPGFVSLQTSWILFWKPNSLCGRVLDVRFQLNSEDSTWRSHPDGTGAMGIEHLGNRDL